MDIIEPLKRRVRSLNPEAAPKLATIQDVERAEASLGFRLPEVLRRIYLEVGNGGFGPAHHPILDAGSAADEYHNSLSDRERSHPAWPPRLLPICDWGCNIYSCLDCSSTTASVIRVDYNHTVPEMRQECVLNPGFQFFEPYSNDAVAAWVEAPMIEGWLSDWLAGVDLFHRAYPEKKPKSVHR